jgi:hypothetical protein
VLVSREANRLVVTLQRWQQPFGRMELNVAGWWNGLELENMELKKILAWELLMNLALF